LEELERPGLAVALIGDDPGDVERADVGAEAHRCDDRREPLVEALADPGPHRGVVRRGDELGELAGGEAAPHDDGIEVAGERVRVGDARVVADAERAERHRAEERGTIERGRA
jgi:hypothetical protein